MQDFTNLQTIDARDSQSPVNQPIIFDVASDTTTIMTVGSTQMFLPNNIIALRSNGATDIVYY